MRILPLDARGLYEKVVASFAAADVSVGGVSDLLAHGLSNVTPDV